MLAGLEEITSGDIRIGGESVVDLPAIDRNIAMVFQNYALYPHMTVAENMGFALRMQKVARAEIDERVRRAAVLLSVEELLDRRPRQLSGGQRQRVAVGRAIVRDPKVFLFDEPLSNLDAKLRNAARVELRDLQQRLETTTVYVTHDQVEAMTMADIIVLMNAGRVIQAGPPMTLYDDPETTFVASFMGSPPMNLVPAVSVANGDRFQYCS
jgi:multiple sugar transport system ATP-binding protein